MENIRYIGDLRHVPPEEIQERGHRYLRCLTWTDSRIGSPARLSGGMKQKLSLVCALVSEPQILLLDEPTTGVDPVSRREFWDTLAHLAGDGLTILVATPYLDEAERCHRIAFMHLGEIRQIGTPAELRAETACQAPRTAHAELARSGAPASEVAGRTSEFSTCSVSAIDWI